MNISESANKKRIEDVRQDAEFTFGFAENAPSTECSLYDDQFRNAGVNITVFVCKKSQNATRDGSTNCVLSHSGGSTGLKDFGAIISSEYNLDKFKLNKALLDALQGRARE